MDDPFFVRGFECIGDLLRVVEGGLKRERPLERSTRHQLHHKSANAVRLLNSIDLGDVGVVERRQNLRFAFEAGEPFGIFSESGRQNLDGDFTVEFGVAGEINFAHASRAQRRKDSVGSQVSPGGEGH